MGTRTAGSGTAHSVCVVIPTFNRRESLLETLGGVDAQTWRPEGVLVFDNASTDATGEAVRSHHPHASVVRSEVNVGSAGGFARGSSCALARGYDWVWLLDDDSVPEPTALAELLAAHQRFPEGARPLLLAAKVEWHDGSILPLNVPIFKRKEYESFYAAAHMGTLSLRAAPYAGLLVHRSLVERHGLPCEEYFLWNDDIEWTGRLLRQDLGVLVPSSVIRHKTPGNPSTTADLGPRFFYEVRNKLWLARGSEAFATMEKVRFLFTLAVDVVRHVRRSRPRRLGVTTVARGLAAGLLSPAPKARRSVRGRHGGSGTRRATSQRSTRR